MTLSRRTLAAAHAALFLTATTFCLAAVSVAHARQTLSAPLTSAGDSNNSGSSTAAVPDVPVDYRLDTGDVVRLEVLKHPDAAQTVTLYADATVRVPRVDKAIVARGLTCEELAAAYSKALNNPKAFRLRPGQVTATLVGARMRRIYVRGSAVKGGDYDLKNGWRVSELAAVLGGVPQPDRVRAQVTNPRRPEPVAVNLERALRDPGSDANLLLMEGDTLVIDAPKTKVLFVDSEGQRGMQNVDERFSLRQALIQFNISASKTENDLTKAVIQRHTVAGDPGSPTREIPVNLLDVLSEKTDVPIEDYDTLQIPISLRFYYVWGELGGERRRFMRLDRPTYLLDVMSDSGNTTPGQAKIGQINIYRTVDGQVVAMKVDYGKFLKTYDPKYNPEIKPGDMVFVDRVKRFDAVNTFWTGWGLLGALRSVVPGL